MWARVHTSRRGAISIWIKIWLKPDSRRLTRDVWACSIYTIIVYRLRSTLCLSSRESLPTKRLFKSNILISSWIHAYTPVYGLSPLDYRLSSSIRHFLVQYARLVRSHLKDHILELSKFEHTKNISFPILFALRSTLIYFCGKFQMPLSHRTVRWP